MVVTKLNLHYGENTVQALRFGEIAANAVKEVGGTHE